MCDHLSSPANSRFRQLLYRMVVSKYYRIFITMVILFHSFTYVVPVGHIRNNNNEGASGKRG